MRSTIARLPITLQHSAIRLLVRRAPSSRGSRREWMQSIVRLAAPSHRIPPAANGARNRCGAVQAGRVAPLAVRSLSGGQSERVARARQASPASRLRLRVSLSCRFDFHVSLTEPHPPSTGGASRRPEATPSTLRPATDGTTIPRAGAERMIVRLERGGRYPTWVLLAALAGMFATTFPVTILTVSLSSIAAEFGARETTIAWVISAPMLLSAMALPLLGKLGDLRGHRRVFLLRLRGRDGRRRRHGPGLEPTLTDRLSHAGRRAGRSHPAHRHGADLQRLRAGATRARHGLVVDDDGGRAGAGPDRRGASGGLARLASGLRHPGRALRGRAGAGRNRPPGDTAPARAASTSRAPPRSRSGWRG